MPLFGPVNPQPKKKVDTAVVTLDKKEHPGIYEIMNMWISGALEEFGCSERFVVTVYVEVPLEDGEDHTWREKPKNLEVILYEGEDKADEYYERIMTKLEELCKSYDEMVMIQPNAKPFKQVIITTNRERYFRKIKKS